MLQHLVHRPRLWPADPTRHRRATWVELFYDLIFVAAIAGVGEPLAHHYTLDGLLRYSFLFLLIWWAWSGHTLYTTRFDADDSVQRVLILVQCFIAAVMAANAKDALDSRSSAGFGAAYAGMRIILVVQYLRARQVARTRALTTHYAAGFGVAAMLWLGSSLLDVPERYWVWAAALAVDFATPWLAAKHAMETPPDPSHYPERFGLFTIILFGEFVASVMRGIEANEDWSLAAASCAFASMAFVFVLRWWYFDGAESSHARHIRSRRSLHLFQIWQYAHLPLFLGIGVAAIGFERAIEVAAHGRLNAAEGWILCGAVAVVMLSLITLQATSETAQRSETLANTLWPQGGIAVLAIYLGMYASHLPPSVIVILLLGGCVGQGLLAARETYPRQSAKAA